MIEKIFSIDFKRKFQVYNLLHPVLLKLMRMQRMQRKQELYILNEHPAFSGRNVIYAVNHSCRYDMPIASEVIEKHTCVLVGKQRLDFIDRLCFLLNGVVYVDRKSSDSRKKAFQRILAHLRQGRNMCIYPEGTWNLTPSKPLLPMYWGIVELSRQSGCPIVPLVLEFRENACWAKFGQAIYVRPEDQKRERFALLEEEMATIKWELWEQFPMVSRSSLDMDEWEQEVQRRIAAYPKLDYEYEKSCVRR